MKTPTNNRSSSPDVVSNYLKSLDNRTVQYVTERAGGSPFVSIGREIRILNPAQDLAQLAVTPYGLVPALLDCLESTDKDWASNLVLYAISGRDALLLAGLENDIASWRRTQKKADRRYWLTWWDRNKVMQQAFDHQKKGRALLAKKDFKQAVYEFRAGLAACAKGSVPARTDVIDDSDQKLTLAGLQQKQGDFEHAANIMERILEGRIERAFPIRRETALEIARVDAGKTNRDWSGYQVSAMLQQNGWQIAYSLKDTHVLGGGGPEYVIDANSGKIVSKSYAR